MIDLGTLREWLGNERQDADDTFLVALEARAVLMLEQLTAGFFSAEASFTEYLDGTGTSELYLSHSPKTGTVVLEAILDEVGWSTVAAADYTVVGRRLVLDYDSTWPKGTANIRVTYTRGYSAGNEPALARQAVLDLCRYLYFEGRHNSLTDLQGNGPGEIPSVKALIAKYRRPMW